MIKRKIVKVDFNNFIDAKVILDDGSELVGITDLKLSYSVNGMPSVTLEAYVYAEKTVTLEHNKTKERVTLTEKEVSRFLENRNPFAWSKVT